jgi:cytidylate kinase
MRINIRGLASVPKIYVKKRRYTAEVVDNIFREWDKKRHKTKNKKPTPATPPTICFSREIGAGALEIAEMLADKIDYRVVDRDIVEYVSKNEDLSVITTAFFNEQYPGLVSEYLSMIFDEKAFVKSDNIRRLFSAILYFAHAEPSIIIGRGAYLLLPRERVLSVRFICSKADRVERLNKIVKAEDREIEEIIDLIDKEQHNFFKHVYGKRNFSPYEFDMIINRDAVQDPERIADIIYSFFKLKFGNEIS